MRLPLLLLLLLLFVTFMACSGEKSPSGFGEPIRVRNGVFKEGALPGATPGAPAITAIETSSTLLRPGQGEKTLGGRASPGSVAVAVALNGLGRGYWLLGVDGPDPLNNNELGFQALIEIARDVPAGSRELKVVAIDANGNGGPERVLPICVPGLVPDNLSACDPNAAPPAAVVTLTWDAPVDLDLIAVAPDGRVIDAKHPRRVLGDADAGAPVVAIDRDSNGACVLDRVQQENLVFQDAPAPGSGSWLVFVNLFQACDRTSVNFRIGVSSRQSVNGKLVLVEGDVKSGALTTVNTNGGARLGTYVTEVPF
jgi:hypothetical protein